MRTRLIVFVFLIGLLLPRILEAGEAPGGRSSVHVTVKYADDIKPLLSRRCYACHGSLKQKAGLRLDTAALMRKGGDGGPAVMPGHSDESLIVDVTVGRDGLRMPPESEGSSLTSDEIAKLKAWIDQGAKAPADEKPQPDPRDHWAFQALKSPDVPSPSGMSVRGDWVKNPIDAFLAAEHKKHALQPRPAADPATLIRRLYLDLIGLLPSPDEVNAFAADPSDLAYEAIVDKLLASPRHGERWGRHWMDVWRYSDWDGFGTEVRESQPHIWRWRDWIVESLNRDAPYDRMIVAMLAADEADPCDAGTLRATGFLVRNWFKFNRNVWLDNAVEHTVKAFLGITLNCAKCHDHKYDPLLQTDYYAFRAFFEPHKVRTDPLPGQPDTTKDGLVRVFDGESATPTFLFERGDDKRPVKDKPLAPSVPKILQLHAKLGPIKTLALPAEAYYPGLNQFVRDDMIAQTQRALLARKAALTHAEQVLADARNTPDADKAQHAVALAKTGLKAARADLEAVEARIAADIAKFAQPPRSDTATLTRAAGRLERKRGLLRAEEAVQDAKNALANAKDVKGTANAQATLAKAHKAVQAARKALTDDSPSYAPLSPIYAATSTGRRLALAHWIASPNNPLTARVAVNQIWMHHTGSPLVPTVFDFGRNGTPPAVPGLLDWLAVRLENEGWRMKPIHRLIVTSALYRMQSTSGGPHDPNLARDPANTYYWKMNARRMEAEAVRDNLLHVAGSLSQNMGGPDLDPEAGLTTSRRSLYLRHAKEKRVTFLRLFDSPNVLSCYRRSESVVPQQALALANSSLCRDQARLLAKRLKGEAPLSNPAAFVSAAFERVLARAPTPDERTMCEEFLKTQANRLTGHGALTAFSAGQAAAVPPAADPAQRAREDLIHVLLNHNDFLTIR
jgi:Protein of unknown function (DUF1553)/Protein of unknown function (DUF1549)/Planctomycete cytochrome C